MTVDAAVCIRIVETEFDYVYRTLRRLGARPADAEDLTQEVFLVMWRRRDDWDPDRPLRPWLWGVAYRVARDHRRRVHREEPMGMIDRVDEGLWGEEHITAVRARSLALRAIASLPEKQRAVLVLHELEGVPVREVASTLEMPLFTVYTRLRTARKSFARAVKRMQLVAAAARPASGLLGPDEVLAVERQAPPAPEDARRRAAARIRALVLGPAELPSPLPAAAGPLRWPLAGAAGAAAAAAVVLVATGVVHGPGGARAAALPAARVSIASTSRGASPGAGKPSIARPRGLVGYWRFDEPAGSALAHDESGGGTDCVLHQLDPKNDWVDGKQGRAIRIDGRGWLECSRVDGLAAVSRELTIAAWVRMDRQRPDLASIVAWQRGVGQRYQIFFGMAGRNLVLASDVWHRMEWPMPPIIGRWVHLAATRAADGTRRLFFDGAEVAREDGTPGRSLQPEPRPLIIGARAKGGEPQVVRQRLDGAIDELAIYDRALAPSEIAALVTRSRGRD